MICFEFEKMDISLSPIQKCIRFLQNGELPGAGNSVDIGDGMRCIVNQYYTIQESDAIWEAHKKYVDVHCILSGKEKIGVAYTDKCETGEYHAEQDYLEVDAVDAGKMAAWFMVEKGTALCLFPNDAHQVKVQYVPGKKEEITKVVFKIPVELF